MGHKPNIIERVMGLQYSVANEQWKDFKINYLLATLPDPLNNTCHQSTTSGVPHDSQFSKQILVVPLCDGEAAGRSALGRERQVEEMLAFAGALYGAAGACPTTSSADPGQDSTNLNFTPASRGSKALLASRVFSTPS